MPSPEAWTTGPDRLRPSDGRRTYPVALQPAELGAHCARRGRGQRLERRHQGCVNLTAGGSRVNGFHGATWVLFPEVRPLSNAGRFLFLSPQKNAGDGLVAPPDAGRPRHARLLAVSPAEVFPAGSCLLGFLSRRSLPLWEKRGTGDLTSRLGTRRLAGRHPPQGGCPALNVARFPTPPSK